jgi:hypothetical protein
VRFYIALLSRFVGAVRTTFVSYFKVHTFNVSCEAAILRRDMVTIYLRTLLVTDLVMY